jgi:Tfp pilus assembly protein PilO
MVAVKAVLAGLVDSRNLARNLGFVAALVAVFLLFQTFYLAPRVRRIGAAQARVTALAGEIAALQGQVQDKRAAAQREAQVLEAFRRLSARAEQAKRMLPTRESLGALLRDLTEPGKRLGVTVASFQPLPSVDLPRLTRLPFKLRAEGSYRDIGRYLAVLENMDRLVVIENLQLACLDGSGRRVAADVFGSTYLVKEEP